jgi:hypothetical protein
MALRWRDDLFLFGDKFKPKVSFYIKFNLNYTFYRAIGDHIKQTTNRLIFFEKEEGDKLKKDIKNIDQGFKNVLHYYFVRK